MKTIAFDFDDTLTAEPELIAGWMHMTQTLGNRAIVVTLRRESEENWSEIQALLVERNLDNVPIFMTSGASKEKFMRNLFDIGKLQWRVDIWVDDSPCSIVSGL